MDTAQQFETGHGAAPAIWNRPSDAIGVYVLAHGAGAGMRHSFMNAIAERLATHRVATLRYEFLYMANGGKRIDREPVLFDTVRAAVKHARELAPDLPMIAGGKSMGGRMTSRAAAVAPLDARGIAFIGFPLHPPKRVSIDRAAHLDDVTLPMLFLQGTRDDLADMPSMMRVIDHVGSRATLHVVEGADHSFHVLKRSGRTDDDVLEELASSIAAFIRRLAQGQ
jgi:predicted alpha/beta-hydrolase family hydrolase